MKNLVALVVIVSGLFAASARAVSVESYAGLKDGIGWNDSYPGFGNNVDIGFDVYFGGRFGVGLESSFWMNQPKSTEFNAQLNGIYNFSDDHASSSFTRLGIGFGALQNGSFNQVVDGRGEIAIGERLKISDHVSYAPYLSVALVRVNSKTSWIFFVAPIQIALY